MPWLNKQLCACAWLKALAPTRQRRRRNTRNDIASQSVATLCLTVIEDVFGQVGIGGEPAETTR